MTNIIVNLTVALYFGAMGLSMLILAIMGIGLMVEQAFKAATAVRTWWRGR